MKRAIFAMIMMFGLCGVSIGMFSEHSDITITIERPDGSMELKDSDKQLIPSQALEILKDFTREHSPCLDGHGDDDKSSTGVEQHEQTSSRAKEEVKCDTDNESSKVIEQYERSFLGNSVDVNTLTKGYNALKEKLNDPGFIEKLDKNLFVLYSNAQDPGLRRTLAELYKEKANSSKLAEDYIRAAFWFRMLLVSGDHSSYLSEYNGMITKSGLKKFREWQ